MITIIPALEVLKSVTDRNQDGIAAQKRRECFDKATDLITRAHVQVRIEGRCFDLISPRLLEDHKKIFETVYRIDRSAVGVQGYDTVRAINFVASKEGNVSHVIILTENPTRYTDCGRAVVITPTTFLERITELNIFYEALKSLKVEKEMKDINFTKALEQAFFNGR